jgi:hypothetical protein
MEVKKTWEARKRSSRSTRQTPTSLPPYPTLLVGEPGYLLHFHFHIMHVPSRYGFRVRAEGGKVARDGISLFVQASGSSTKAPHQSRQFTETLTRNHIPPNALFPRPRYHRYHNLMQHGESYFDLACCNAGWIRSLDIRKSSESEGNPP